MKEEWKDIEGYEGYYQISNLGRVKSLKRKVKNNGTYGGWCTYNEKVIVLGRDPNGYPTALLCKNKKTKAYRVHRCVALAFIDNPNNYKEVNHIDGNKSNSNVKNLEWCSHTQNMQHAWDNNLVSREGRLSGKDHRCSIKIQQFDLQGNHIKDWDSMGEAAKELKLWNQNISKCCNGIYKQTGGFIFRLP